MSLIDLLKKEGAIIETYKLEEYEAYEDIYKQLRNYIKNAKKSEKGILKKLDLVFENLGFPSQREVALEIPCGGNKIKVLRRENDAFPTIIISDPYENLQLIKKPGKQELLVVYFLGMPKIISADSYSWCDPKKLEKIKIIDKDTGKIYRLKDGKKFLEVLRRKVKEEPELD